MLHCIDLNEKSFYHKNKILIQYLCILVHIDIIYLIKCDLNYPSTVILANKYQKHYYFKLAKIIQM